MRELNPKEILETISELEKQSDKLCELLSESILLEMRDIKTMGLAIALSGLRQISFDIDHGLILNVGAILKLREMLDKQEAGND